VNGVEEASGAAHGSAGEAPMAARGSAGEASGAARGSTGEAQEGTTSGMLSVARGNAEDVGAPWGGPACREMMILLKDKSI
jgi:hypothetical protein